jgi:hypothetical protein
MHHALYDGWSMPLVLEQVEHAYRGKEWQPLSPFQGFIKYLTSIDGEQEHKFWQNQFSGLEVSPFPVLPSPLYQPQANGIVEHHVKVEWPRTNSTPATIVRAAWAILLARYTDSSDVAFGVTVIGRQAPVAGIERMAAPTICHSADSYGT